MTDQNETEETTSDSAPEAQLNLLAEDWPGNPEDWPDTELIDDRVENVMLEAKYPFTVLRMNDLHQALLDCAKVEGEHTHVIDVEAGEMVWLGRREYSGIQNPQMLWRYKDFGFYINDTDAQILFGEEYFALKAEMEEAAGITDESLKIVELPGIGAWQQPESFAARVFDGELWNELTHCIAASSDNGGWAVCIKLGEDGKPLIVEKEDGQKVFDLELVRGDIRVLIPEDKLTEFAAGAFKPKDLPESVVEEISPVDLKEPEHTEGLAAHENVIDEDGALSATGVLSESGGEDQASG